MVIYNNLKLNYVSMERISAKKSRVAISVRFSVIFMEDRHTDSENVIIFYILKLEKLMNSKPFESKRIPATPEAKIL